MMQVSKPKLDGIIFDGLIPPESMPEWDLSYRTALVDDVGPGDIRQFMGTLLSFPELRERIPNLINELANGNTDLLTDTVTELREAHQRLAPYPQSEPSIPLVMLISGSENNSRRNLNAETVADEAKDALFTHPLPGLLANASAPFYDRDDYFGQLPERLPRTLIIHGTLDPSTPYEGARLHAELLSKAGDLSFSTVTGGAHFLPVVAPECFIQAASAFVSTNEVPEHCESL